MPVNLNEVSGNPLPRNDVSTRTSSENQSDLPSSSALSVPESEIKSVPNTRWYGVYPALVRDINDPENLGRIKVLLTWVPDSAGIVGIEREQQYEGWARLTTFMGGQNRGAWFIPEIDDEVLISFAGGHPGRPFVMGSLWNGEDIPPAAMDSARENNVKLIKSRAGNEIKIHDKAGDEYIQIQTPNGQRIKLSDYNGGGIKIQDDNGNVVELKTTGINISSNGTVDIKASKIKLDAGKLDVRSGIAKFSGIVQSDTIITKSVVASSYTPGTGNIW